MSDRMEYFSSSYLLKQTYDKAMTERFNPMDRHQTVFNSPKVLPLWAIMAAALICGAQAGAQAPGGAPPAPEVAYVEIKPREILLTTELPARTAACLTAEVRPQVGGIIQKRLFTEGADVKEGQLLYQIDPATYRAALDNSEAALTTARRAVDSARSALDSGKAGVEQAEAALELAVNNLKRYEPLLREGVISSHEYDPVATQKKVAQANLESAQAQLKIERRAVEQAEAGVAQAEAAVRSARINLDYTQITAPISGRIGRSTVTVGALVAAYQGAALATIQQLDPVYIDAPESTTKLLELRQSLSGGQLGGDADTLNKVKLMLENGAEYPQEGTLQFRDVTVEPSTGSVILRMSFPNPDRILLPGMFVRAVIPEGVNAQAILAPQQGVTRNTKGQPQCYVIGSNNKAELRKLTLERTLGDEWLVSEGLKAGDRIIVEGLQKIRDGVEVRPVVFNNTPAPRTASTEH